MKKLATHLVTAAMLLVLAACHALPSGPTADEGQPAPGSRSTSTADTERIEPNR
jgi:hypothetical protein